MTEQSPCMLCEKKAMHKFGGKYIGGKLVQGCAENCQKLTAFQNEVIEFSGNNPQGVLATTARDPTVTYYTSHGHRHTS